MTVTIISDNPISVGDNVYNVSDMEKAYKVVCVLSSKTCTTRDYRFGRRKKMSSFESVVEIE